MNVSSLATMVDVNFREGDNQLIGRVLGLLTIELVRRKSGLVVDGSLDELFSENTREILVETLCRLRIGDLDVNSVSVNYGSTDGLKRTGRARAGQERHPAESLMGAELVFGIALPLVVDYAEQFELSSGTNGVSAARVLHHSIWRRFPSGAIAYVEVMLEKLSAAHVESRKQVSRELHDRVAHGIAAAMQRVELAQLQGPAEREQNLRASLDILQSALLDVQDMAVSMRQVVGQRPLDEAIMKFIQNLEPGLPETRIVVSGSSGELVEPVKEELFAIAVEAIRNARQHVLGATQVTVHMAWKPTRLDLVIENDGASKDPSFARAGGIGLASMRERTQIIGGRLSWATANGTTKVTISLPLTVGFSG